MAINRYSGNGVEQTLEQYVPLPFEEMFKAGQAIQQRGDLAEAQRDQVETGLSSMETMASGQSTFKNKFVDDYKKEGMELIKKYPNPSDPEFIRESRKLNMKYATDPRLQTIKQTNEFLKTQQKLSQELSAKGIKSIDPNRNFTGIDNNGNLIAPKSSLRGTNFDEDLTKSFLQIRDNMVDDGKGWKSNKGNLDRLAGNLVKNLETNPVTKDAIDYYMQQGMSIDQAKEATKGLIQQAYTDNLRTDRDYQFDQFKLSQAKFEYDKAKDRNQSNYPPQLPFELLSYSKVITPNTNKDVSKTEVRSNIEKILKGLSSDGNLNNKSRDEDDTPENRKLFGNNATPVTRTITGSGMGYGSSSYNVLQVKNYNPQEVNLLNTARKVLGIKGGSAKEVFTRYNDLLKQFDQASNSIKTTDNIKINNASAEIARRQIATGEVYSINKGNLEKVNFEDLNEDEVKELADIKPDNISGISPKNLGQLSGYTQFTDKKGKTYYTPLPEEYQSKFAGSKIVENYLQDFDPKNLKSQRIEMGGKEVNVFINPNQSSLPYIYKGVKGQLVPYKSKQGDKIVAGALFMTDKGYAPLPLSAIEENEFNSLYSKVGNNNKIEGN